MTLESDIYPKTTHLHCLTCDTTSSFKSLVTVPPKDEAEIDTYYDVVSCCGDPFLEALLISDKPLFPEDNPDSEVNMDAVIDENPRLGIEKTHWKYTVDEDFFNKLRGQEDDDAPMQQGAPKAPKVPKPRQS